MASYCEKCGCEFGAEVVESPHRPGVCWNCDSVTVDEWLQLHRNLSGYERFAKERLRSILGDGSIEDRSLGVLCDKLQDLVNNLRADRDKVIAALNTRGPLDVVLLRCGFVGPHGTILSAKVVEDFTKLVEGMPVLDGVGRCVGHVKNATLNYRGVTAQVVFTNPVKNALDAQ